MINWFKSKKAPLKKCAEGYLIANKPKLNRKQSFLDQRFVVLDCETTGFSPENDRILSVATMEVINGQIDLARSRHWIVFQPNASVTSSSVIHGILPSETRQGIPEDEVIQELMPLLADAIVVGHHIGFDATMLDTAFRRHFNTGFRNHVIDTAILARQELVAFHKSGYANQRPPSLEDVCEHLSLPMIARHTAEGDAFVTAQVFLLLSGRMRRRMKRPVTLRDLPVTRMKR